MTPRSGAGKLPAPERALMGKYGFDINQAKQVSAVFNNNSGKVRSFGSMSLHIKGMGFLRNEIAELVELLGDSALDLANWQGMKGMSRSLGSGKLMYLAYTAGLTANDVAQMKPEDLSEDKLRIMASLRSL